MLIDDILKQKHDMQVLLAEKSGYEPKKMAELAHNAVLNLSKKRKITLKYFSDFNKEHINKQSINHF